MTIVTANLWILSQTICRSQSPMWDNDKAALRVLAELTRIQFL